MYTKQTSQSVSESRFSASASNSAVSTLTAQWYNTVTAALSLSPQSFQLMQGFLPVGSQSEPLWQAFDAVPPQAVGTYYQPTGLNLFSQEYDSVVNALNLQGSSEFVKIMASDYAAWQQAMPKRPATMPLQTYFQQWAESNITNPSQMEQAITAYDQLLSGTVPEAATMWTNMLIASSNAGVVAYTTTIDDVNTALGNGPKVAFAMNSASESSNVSGTWASGSVGGALGFFDGGGDGSMSDITSAIAAATIEINATFNHVITVAAGPLTETSTNKILAAYTPWYESAALSLAYGTQGSSVWNSDATVTWDTAFGSDGALLRASTGLVVVDGIDMTITSSVSLSSSQQEQVQAAVEAGFWPFFTANASGGSFINDVSFESGKMTLSVKAPTGQPWVLGVLVTSIADLFGS